MRSNSRPAFSHLLVASAPRQVLIGIIDSDASYPRSGREGAKAEQGDGPASLAVECLGRFCLQGGQLMAKAAISAGAAPVLRSALSRWAATAPAAGAGWDPSSPALKCADAVLAIASTDDDPCTPQLLFKVRVAHPPRSWGGASLSPQAIN